MRQSMARQTTVGGVAVLDLLKALRHTGIEPAPLCRAVEIDTTSLEDADARVPVRSVTRLLALAEHRSRDPWVGLHAGERAEPRGPLFYLVASSARLGDGLERVERFSGLAVDTLRMTLRSEPPVASVIFEPGDPVFSASRHAVEYLLMTLVRGLRSALGGTLPIREVHFRHRRAGSHGPAEQAFGCPVRFGAGDHRIVFPHSALRTASRFANRAIGGEIEKFAVALSARLEPRATLAARVTQAARALLAAGIRPDAARIGAKLGMSCRTLQRKLAGEGASFRALRDAVLWKTVEALLSNPSLKIEAIALSVGFSDVAAFSKAFRRWRGRPPTHYREALARARVQAVSLGSLSGLRRRSSR
jgi:AraC-like DNA-binding protein